MKNNRYMLEMPLYEAIMAVKHEILEACDFAKMGDEKMAYKELLDAHEMVKTLLEKTPFKKDEIMEHYDKMREHNMGYRGHSNPYYRSHTPEMMNRPYMPFPPYYGNNDDDYPMEDRRRRDSRGRYMEHDNYPMEDRRVGYRTNPDEVPQEVEERRIRR